MDSKRLEDIGNLATKFAISLDFTDVDALISTGEMLQEWHKDNACASCQSSRIAVVEELSPKVNDQYGVNNVKRKSRMSVCVLPQIFSSDDESSEESDVSDKSHVEKSNNADDSENEELPHHESNSMLFDNDNDNDSFVTSKRKHLSNDMFLSSDDDEVENDMLESSNEDDLDHVDEDKIKSPTDKARESHQGDNSRVEKSQNVSKSDLHEETPSESEMISELSHNANNSLVNTKQKPDLNDASMSNNDPDDQIENGSNLSEIDNNEEKCNGERLMDNNENVPTDKDCDDLSVNDGMLSESDNDSFIASTKKHPANNLLTSSDEEKDGGEDIVNHTGDNEVGKELEKDPNLNKEIKHISKDESSGVESDNSILLTTKKSHRVLISSDDEQDGSFLEGFQNKRSVERNINRNDASIKTLFPKEKGQSNFILEDSDSDDDSKFDNFIQTRKPAIVDISSEDEKENSLDNFIVNDSDDDLDAFKTPAQEIFYTPRPRNILSEQRFNHLKTPKSATKNIIDQYKTSQLQPCTPAYKREFNKIRDKAVSNFFELFNRTIFDNKLDPAMSITWNKRMTKTAGFCIYQEGTGGDRSCKIELSDKVLDCVERLRDTLIHELCHAATWVIDGKKVNHGPAWQYWAKKANRIHSDLPIIKRCHQYEIHTKYNYQCNGCDKVFGRHSKSIDPARHRCPYCGGIPVLLENSRTPSAQKAPNSYALFLKKNFASVKKSNPNVSHKELMKIIAEKFREMKTSETEVIE